MRRFGLLLGALPLAALVGLTPGDAEACGGCFVPPEAATQVTGHRMLMAIGMEQSTLYDQIEYSGDPESFAWVLPIRGQADLGVSSDLVFNQLAFDTDVTVVPPPLNCPPSNCNQSSGFSATSGGFDGEAPNGGVDVIAQEVVGPYETVQLASDDPAALADWLAGHGYQIPAEIQPIVAAYVAEDFNFLAMKLIPGVGTSAMRPVRVTTFGASPVLPLRMVAAGTGAVTPITLWVIAEGRYEPVNFPFFKLEAEALVWNWDDSSSNYNALRQQAYDASSGHAWQMEASNAYSGDSFRSQILSVVDFLFDQSGYGDGDWESAQTEAQEDMDVLFASLDPSSVTVTRLRAELTREALVADLQLGASDDQSPVERVLQVTSSIGTRPACPPPVDCNGDSTSAGAGAGGAGTYFGPGASASGDDEGQGCNVARVGAGDAAFGGLISLLFGAGWVLRRRRRA